MEQNADSITIQQLCNVIDLLHPCMDDYLYVYDLENDFYYISPSAVKKFPLPGNQFHGVLQAHCQFVYPPDLDALLEDLDALMKGERNFHNLEYRWVNRDGQPVWINCRGYVVRRNDAPCYMIGCINEIGKKQKADNVSGLLGESSLELFLLDVLPSLSGGYLLRLGLDNFKEINENLGIDYGDSVLRKTAECISSCLNSGQKLYRIVADEFIILDFLGGTRNEAVALYKKIRQAIDHLIEESNYEAVFTISGGLLTCDDMKDCSYANIMMLSEFTLNEAKRQGRNRCYSFQKQDYERFVRKRELTRALRQAVNDDFEGFEAYFQPLFHAENDTLYGAEALMRFHSQDFGMVSPVEFVPLLEETGLIIPVGRWILRESLRACKNIQEKIPDFRISINVSYIQFMKSDIISEIALAATDYSIDLSKVVIELTESGMLESDARFTRLWSKLKDTGIRLALDDFGTGYSNFHYLYDLRPDIIKFDRTFTIKALENEYDYNLLWLMSEMSHNLNLKICVEGIETAIDRERIQELAPDYIQGFYFGKPCPYDEFIQRYVAA